MEVQVTWLHPSIRLGGRCRGQSVTLTRSDAEAYARKHWCTPPPTPIAEGRLEELADELADEEVPDVPPDSEE